MMRETPGLLIGGLGIFLGLLGITWVLVEILHWAFLGILSLQGCGIPRGALRRIARPMGGHEGCVTGFIRAWIPNTC